MEDSNPGLIYEMEDSNPRARSRPIPFVKLLFHLYKSRPMTVSVRERDRESTFSPYLLISLSLRLRVYSALLDKIR